MKTLFKLLALVLLFSIAYSCKKNTGDTEESALQSRPKNGTGPVHWWRHRNAVNFCSGSGVYCIPRKLLTADELATYVPTEEDEVLTDFAISLEKNVIQINLTGTKGNLLAGTIKAFGDKKIEPMGNYLPFELLEPLFKAIKLQAPKEGIIIKPEEQSYIVNETTFEGKKVSIVEAYEKTKIEIDGKSYRLLIITTSGKGAGSPRQQGF